MRAVSHQRGKGVGQRHRSANGDVLRRVFNLAQCLDAGDVQHLGKGLVQLVHPQSDIGATRHQLRRRVGRAGRQQGGQGGGCDIS